MRPNRNNLILIALLVVQIIIGVSLFIPSSAATVKPGALLLPAFKSEDVTGLIIHNKDKSELDLSKLSNGQWVLSKFDNFPATSANVTSFLDKIKALDTSRLIAQNTSSFTRLGVGSDAYESMIEITTPGNHVDKLYIGTSSGVNATNTRLNDDQNVYLTSGLASSDATTNVGSWIDTTYFSAVSDNVNKVSITNANGTVDFLKAGGVWKLQGMGSSEVFADSNFTTVLNQLSNLSISSPLGLSVQDKYGMNAPTATITITVSTPVSPTATPTTAAGVQPILPTATNANVQPAPTTTVDTTTTLVFGAKLADGNYVLKGSNSTYYVEIAASTAEAFIHIKRQGFLATPTPTTVPTAAATTASTTAPTSAPTSAATAVATTGSF